MADFYKWIDSESRGILFIVPLKIVDNYLGLVDKNRDGNFELQGTLPNPDKVGNYKIIKKQPLVENKEVLKQLIKYLLKHI